MEYFKQFKKHILENNLPSTVSLWQEYCMSDEVDPEEMSCILEGIKSAPFVHSFGVYVEDGLDLWENLTASRAKNEVLKLIFDIQTSNSAKLVEIALSYLNEKYGFIEIFQELLRITGLRDGEDFVGCIRNFELLIHMQKGNFCMHKGSWGVGEVIDISFLRREVSIEFDLVSDVKDISFQNAFKILEPISSDHFLARRFGDPEKFEAFTRANPIDSIKLLLKDLGNMTAYEIKEEMVDLVIPEEEWTKWWSSVRSKLKKDTEIIYPSSIKEPFKLNTIKETHEDRLKASAEEARTVAELIDVFYIFLRDFSTLGKEDAISGFIKSELANILFDKNISTAEELQILFLLEDLKDPAAKNIAPTVKKVYDTHKVVKEMHILSYKRRFLALIKENREDWLSIFCDLIVSKTKHSLRDFLYEEVLSAKKEDELAEKLENLIENPKASTYAYIWFFQKVMKKKMKLFADQHSLERSFEAFFVLLYHVEVSLKDKPLTKKMYNMIADKRFEIVRRIFENATVISIKELLLLATKCQVLTSHDVNIFYSLAAVVHPELSRESVEDVTKDEIIWTTKEGLSKITARIEVIATKEVIENAKEIEIARAHGDLRENSEYKFAMEKRARLQKEIKSLSAQVKNMKVLAKGDIDTSKVSIGTTVSVESEDGENKDFTILGPFDADTEKNIISAQSKLAKYLIDKKVGENVTFSDTTWKINKISSVLE